MIRLQGKTVCSGMCSGKVFVFRRAVQSKKDNKAVCTSNEIKRLKNAVAEVKNDLDNCAANSESDTARGIFEIHSMMLEDEDILSSLWEAVRTDSLTAEDAVEKTGRTFSKMLLDTGDEYMMARADDVRDVFGKLSAVLSNAKPTSAPNEPFILVADELMPGELMEFEQKKLSGIILKRGTTYSHVSILIREMGIPAVICEELDAVENGMCVLLDGDRGEVLFAPDDEAKAEFMCEHSGFVRAGTISSEQFPCALYVNIGAVQDAKKDVLEKCDGVGLFRTEFLYMNSKELPDEEKQFQIYKELLCAAGGKPVTIRTFDIGSDKQSPALSLPAECNPALGCRGLRVYSVYPMAFEVQLRALLRAAAFGNLRIMCPMVNSCAEIYQIRSRIDEVAESLAKQGVEYRIPPLGAMYDRNTCGGNDV